MNSVAALSMGKRRELFSATAARKGMTSAIVEKDFWVCWVLLRLFDHPALSSKILFKGGTSLSKVFNLIERFSEDIDLVLDWRLLTSAEPDGQRSRTQQERVNEEIVLKANDYNLAKPGTLRLMSPAHVEDVLRKDYEAMRMMVFGEYLLFNDVLTEIRTLEREIHSLK